MKISDGNWLVQENLEVMNAMQFFAAEPVADGLRVYVAPRDVSSRGAQVDVALFTYTFFSCEKETLGVRIEHFRGKYNNQPQFVRQEAQPENLSYTEDAAKIVLRSGRLTAELAKTGDWRITYFYDGKKITQSPERAAGYAKDKQSAQPYVFEHLNLGVGELVYGLGERFTPFIKNGQTVDLWNCDGGTGTEQAYKNVPFYLTNRGYGIFIDQPDKVSLEIASEKVSQVQFSVPGESLAYHVIGGGNPKAVLEHYTAITGRAPHLPAWSFGLWLSTSFTTNYDEETVTRFIDGMQERHIPLHVFHFDCFWMKGLHWSDFEWDKDVFPQPQEMLARLKAKGLKICVWLNPYISQLSRLFDEGMQKHYFIETKEGDVWQWDRWQPAMAIVDFTNPKAKQWYQGYLAKLLDMGVDCFKTDFGERIPVDAKYADGSSPEKMHNYYTHLYNQAVFEVLKKKRGEGEAVLFARSATAGGQQFPVHWGGDCKGNFDSMAETLRGGLSLGLSGFAFWSHDIGGFENTSPASVYKRWCAFGLLSSHSRLHGSQSYRIPWSYDEEAVDVLRHFTQWKCRLMPYLYELAEQAHETGAPLMRAMLLEFPDDPTCGYLDRQYMLGNALLVAPVLREDNMAEYYLPEGTWTHLFTGRQVKGGSWQHEAYGFMSLPLFVRENTILALGSHNERPDYAYLTGLNLYIAHLTDGGSAVARVLSLARDQVLTVSAQRKGTVVTVEFTNLEEPCTLSLPAGQYALQQGESVKHTDGAQGDMWQIASGTKQLVFVKKEA